MSPVHNDIAPVYYLSLGKYSHQNQARQTYKEATDDVHDLVTFYSEKYTLPMLKTVFVASVGFSMSVSVEELEESLSTTGGASLPLEFVNVVKKRKIWSFTSLKLVSSFSCFLSHAYYMNEQMSLNERIQESLTEVYLMSDKCAFCNSFSYDRFSHKSHTEPSRTLSKTFVWKSLSCTRPRSVWQCWTIYSTFPISVLVFLSVSVFGF